MNRAVGLAMIAVGIGTALCGCANAKYYQGTDLSLAPKYTIIHGLPIVTQTDKYSCGRACLASVALYYDVPCTTVEELTLSATQPEQALTGAQLVRAAESFGLLAFGYEGSFDDLKDNIQKNRPVIALLDTPPKVAKYPAFEWVTETSTAVVAQPHWVVVLGLGHNGEVIIHDPNKGLLEMSAKTFDKQWQKQSRVTVLVGKRL